MNAETLRHLLDQVASGDCRPEQAIEKLRDLPFDETSDAVVDLHRQLRQGFPEVVFGSGKTADQVTAILRRLHEAHGAALATRVSADAAASICANLPDTEYDSTSRLLRWGGMRCSAAEAPATIVSAGSSDEPVAAEVAGTLDFLGHRTQVIRDVGVAGLHRLLSRLEELRKASVIVVVAGMEGALPSVIGGLVAQPVIAVPTSVGYGASFGGLSALLTMLNSCASGLTIVNIDNGFGAAIAAHRILAGTPSAS
jgi:NCAIR mutase (PurE)-related protein